MAYLHYTLNNVITNKLQTVQKQRYKLGTHPLKFLCTHSDKFYFRKLRCRYIKRTDTGTTPLQQPSNKLSDGERATINSRLLKVVVFHMGENRGMPLLIPNEEHGFFL